MCSRVPQVLIQIANQTLLCQKGDGTWGPEICPERDAYAILTLLAVTSLPHAKIYELKIQSAIQSGRHALLQCESLWAEPQYLWIEKVIYGSSALAETYCVSAMNAPIGTHQWTDRFKEEAGIHSQKIMRLSKFFSSLPTLRKEPSWKILVRVITRNCITSHSTFRPQNALRRFTVGLITSSLHFHSLSRFFFPAPL